MEERKGCFVGRKPARQQKKHKSRRIVWRQDNKILSQPFLTSPFYIHRLETTAAEEEACLLFENKEKNSRRKDCCCFRRVRCLKSFHRESFGVVSLEAHLYLKMRGTREVPLIVDWNGAAKFCYSAETLFEALLRASTRFSSSCHFNTVLTSRAAELFQYQRCNA